MRGNVENKNNSVNIRFVDKTSDVRNLSENITSDVMLIYQSGNTGINDPNFWCSLEVATAELHLFVSSQRVTCGGNALQWLLVTIVVLHHKHMKLFKPLFHMLLRGPSEKVLLSRFVKRKSRKRDRSA